MIFSLLACLLAFPSVVDCYYNQQYESVTNSQRSHFAGSAVEWDLKIPVDGIMGYYGPLVLTPSGVNRIVTFLANETSLESVHLNLIDPDGNWKSFELPGYPIAETTLETRAGDMYAAFGSPFKPYRFQGIDGDTGEVKWVGETEFDLDLYAGLFAVSHDKSIVAGVIGNDGPIYSGSTLAKHRWSLRGDNTFLSFGTAAASFESPANTYLWFSNTSEEFSGILGVDTATGKILTRFNLAKDVTFDMVTKPTFPPYQSTVMYNLLTTMGFLEVSVVLVKTDMVAGITQWVLNITEHESNGCLPPALSNDNRRAYISCDHDVYGVDLAPATTTPKILWSQNLGKCGNPIPLPPVISSNDKTVVVICANKVLVLDELTGDMVKNFTTVPDPSYESYFTSMMGDQGNNIYFCYGDAYVPIYKLPTGKLGVTCSKRHLG